MKRRPQLLPPPAATPPVKLTPLLHTTPDERVEHDSNDPISAAISAAAARTPPKKYPRLQTLPYLAQQHVAAMHSGDFVARSRLRWSSPIDDAAQAYHVSRESAALVLQSAWRRSAAMRLRLRLVRRIWTQQQELAAWLSRDREQLRSLVETLMTAAQRPLVAVAARLQELLTSSNDSSSAVRLRRGAWYYTLPRLLLRTWLCFAWGIQRRSRQRFLRRPTTAMIHAIHVPVRNTCRLLVQLWRITTRVALMCIQCRVRSYLARCKYWRLLLVHRRTQAAIRLQTACRAFVAKRLVWRLRRWRAAVRLQCAWRCFQARRRVVRQRISQCAGRFVTSAAICAVERAAKSILQHAARQIQRVYRGQCARAKFRVLVATRQQRQWHRNPSKGYRLFRKGEYAHAAVYLERCFRQGIFQDGGGDDGYEVNQIRNQNQPSVQRLASGSRLTYSFSETPAACVEMPRTPLYELNHKDGGGGEAGEGGRSHRRPATAEAVISQRSSSRSAATSVAQQLRFWHAYALSHWFSFHANGDPLHLVQARVGLESYLRIDTDLLGPQPAHVGQERQFQQLHARYALALCVYWASDRHMSTVSPDDGDSALGMCIEVVDALEIQMGSFTSAEMKSYAQQWSAQLIMTSAALYLKQQEIDACYAQLQTLLQLAMVTRDTSPVFEELELQFLIALVLLQQQQDACGPEEQIRNHAEAHLKRCYQILELRPALGFYHGVLSSSAAATRLQDEPVGAFLIHHDVCSAQESQKLLLKVKLSDDPCKISSLRIHQNDEGLYHMKKLPNSSYFSIHELIQQLPKAAGVQWAKGVRRTLYVAPLEKQLPQATRQAAYDRASFLLGPWDQWRWRIDGSSRTRRNESWAALCQFMAVRLEAADAFAMAAFVARDGLVSSRNRELRAELLFSLGRAMTNLQRRVDAVLALQQAAIESSRLPPAAPFHRNFRAVTRAALSRTQQPVQSFASRLERTAKIERMCVKAWSFHSCSSRLRGSAFCEALLLQRIDDELDHGVGDTFFLRSLLRAHLKAFVRSDRHELKHVELAVGCVARLFDQYHEPLDESELFSVCSHVPRLAAKSSTAALSFSVPRLLLTWHRMPFQVAFEMAEVLYRWPAMDGDALIDVYESLYGRLQSVKPRQWVYAAHEELLLVRLAFLYAHRSTHGDGSSFSSAVSSLHKAIELLDELLALRTMRTLAGQRHVTPVKRIQWPTANVRLPIQFTREELTFVRGFLWERLSQVIPSSSTRQQQEAEASAWRDYDELHRSLLALMLSEQQRERESGVVTKRLRGVRVFVGETKHVAITDVLHSKPFVAVQCDGQRVMTQHAATWMNQLSPGWNEHVEVDVVSSKARVMVTVMNKSTRLRRNGDGDGNVLGYVQVFIEELLQMAVGAGSQPKWYDLVCREELRNLHQLQKQTQPPQIRLGFQLLMQAAKQPKSSEPTKTPVVMRGNWAIHELKRNLRGDLRPFVTSAFVWRWFGRQWLADKEFCIAAWFLQRAVDAAASSSSSSSGTTDTNEDRVAFATDLVGLTTCYRATMGDAWRGFARPLLDQALRIFQGAYVSSGSGDKVYAKQIYSISQLLREDGPDITQSPLEKELNKKIPASSRWIAIQRRGTQAGQEGGVYYFNEDTCERFQGVESEPNIHEPLEWEATDGSVVVATATGGRDPLQPRRVVVLTTEMQARVAFHCQQQQELHAQDPFQWVAVFNPRKNGMQFLSLVDDSDASQLQMTTVQPPTYALVVDPFVMYNVLVVQDAFRKFQTRRSRQRRLRGLFASACGLAMELVAARKRLYERAERFRKSRLNCISVLVEKASGLRAMDLLTSDPFVTMELLDGEGRVVAKGETSVRHNTRNPRWHEEFALHYAFLDHDAQRPHSHTPQLRFQVHDHDMMAAFQHDDDDEEGEEEEEGDDAVDQGMDANTGSETKKKQGETVVTLSESTPDKKNKKKKTDFLGLAVAEIEPLVDGRCVTADLTLRDHDGYESPRSRGTLTLTVQWLHDAEMTIKARRNAVKPMLLVRPRRRPRPKPAWTPEWRAQLEIVQLTRATLLSRMSDTGVLLDQLVRLFKRWKLAQASGKTADEAKLLEQRLVATMASPQQFLAKQEALLASGYAAQEAVRGLGEMVRIPIEDYIESCERTVAATLRVSFHATWISLQDAQVPTLSELRGGGEGKGTTPSMDGCVRHLQGLLALAQIVVTWRVALLDVASSFLEAASPVVTWREPDGAMATLLQFEKISATLLDVVGSTGSAPAAPGSRPGSAAPASANKTAAVDTPSTAMTTSTATPTVTKPSAAVAKRMERIEREKKKAAAKANKKKQ